MTRIKQEKNVILKIWVSEKQPEPFSRIVFDILYKEEKVPFKNISFSEL